MSKNLPKTLYVRREVDGQETYLVANEKLREHCDLDEFRIVGEYKLIKRMEVTAEVVSALL